MATTVGFLLFPKLTQLDLTGPFEVFARMPDTQVRLVWKRAGPVKTDRCMEIVADTGYADCPQLDIVIVPGGPGQNDLMEDEETLAFLRRQAAGARYVCSVCTGSLVLAAAGLMKGYRSTCHWSALHLLAPLGATPVSERVVIDRDRISGAGVSSGIDFALVMAEKLHGRAVAEAIQLQIEYDPKPPFNTGSTHVAPPSLVEELRKRTAALGQARTETVARVAARLGT